MIAQRDIFDPSRVTILVDRTDDPVKVYNERVKMQSVKSVPISRPVQVENQASLF